jgi:hypothetical protein
VLRPHSHVFAASVRLKFLRATRARSKSSPIRAA